MTNKRIRDIEGYEAFKADCEFFRCEEEYPGWTGTEMFGIITGLTKEELEEKYPQFIKAMSPYILLDLKFGEIRTEGRRNEDKFEKRNKHSNSIYEMDEEAEAMHPELATPDFITEMIEQDEQEERTIRDITVCRLILSQMNECQKKRLVMKYVMKMTVYEIADAEGCSEPAVVKSLKNAEEKFKKIYEKGLSFDTPNSMHYEGVSSILDRIAASIKSEKKDEEN